MRSAFGSKKRSVVENLESRRLLSAGATITGTAYCNNNSSGVAASETIYLDANNNSDLDGGELSTTTNAAGVYQFSNVPAGAYIVRQILLDGYTQVTPANNYGDHITASSGATITGQDFTDTAGGGTVSGSVTVGSMGLNSVTVYLDANNNSILDSGELSTSTGSSGAYSFSNVPPGAYIVRQVMPAGYRQVSPANGYGDHITVGDGTSTVAGQNFTDAAVASGASISGSVTAGGAGLGNVTVYLDANNNGVLDSSEMSTTTSASGVYQFTNVPAGAYIVRQVLAAGQTQVSPGSGYGIHLTVQSNSSYSGENFVDASGSAGISGTVFNDANGNGVNDDNDGGVAGLTVYLDLNNSGAPTSNDPTTTTDSSGNYSFTGLAAGSYIVRVVAASGYHQTTPSNNYGQHVTVSAGQPDVGVNFGEQAVNLDTFTQISWQTAAPGPIIRAEALRASVNGLLYVFGGFNGNNGPVLRSDVYNPATNSWSEIANLPERLTHAGVAVYGNLVYFVGGYVGIPNETGFAQIFGTSDVWIYNTTTNTFSAGPSLPAQYAGGGAVIVGNMLHFFGGFDINRNDVNIHLVLNLADPSAGWSALAPIPYSVNHMGYVNYDGLIYAIDGQTGYDAGLTTQDYVQIYDPTTNTWTQGAPCPVSRSHIANATFVMGDRIIFLGGEEANEVETAGVYAYTPSTNTWTQLTSLPSALFSGVGAEINGLIYFTSGGNTTTTYVGTPL